MAAQPERAAVPGNGNPSCLVLFGAEVELGRKVGADGNVLIWGETGSMVLSRPGPGVIYVIGLGNFDGPYDDGPMCDFDREIEAHGSLSLFLDVRRVQRGSRKSRERWKEWASANNQRHRSHVLVSSSLLHMAMSVIALMSGTVMETYSNEVFFLEELKRRAPGARGLPTVPSWVTSTSIKPLAAASGDE